MMATEEKKCENDNEDGYILCDLQKFFNLKQSGTKIFDLRSQKEYQTSHVVTAKNIAKPLQLKEFKSVIDGFRVLLYGNKEQITKKILNHLSALYYRKYPGRTSSLYLFEGEFDEISKAFSFLCCDMETVKYPNMILKNELFLGNGTMAATVKVLNDLCITHIVRVTNGNYKALKGIKCLQIEIEDDAKESEKLYQHFDKANEFIDDALSNKSHRVFVHCNAGVSRSASVVIAHLMQSKKMTLCDAWVHVKQCRNKINPNHGFMKKLIELEKKLYGKSTEKEWLKAFNTM